MTAMMVLQHVSTTDVHYYLAFRMTVQQDLVVAYRAQLPHLALIQPVYKRLLQDLVPSTQNDQRSCAKQKKV